VAIVLEERPHRSVGPKRKRLSLPGMLEKIPGVGTVSGELCWSEGGRGQKDLVGGGGGIEDNCH
jgi:hypothetical protein